MGSGEEFDSDSFLNENKNPSEIARCLFFCLMLAYSFYEIDLALDFLEKCRLHINFICATSFLPDFVFYDGLIYSSIAKKNKEAEDHTKHLEECICKIKRMSERAPENYQNKYHLLKAECATVDRDESEANFHFEKSILLSKKHRFPH